MQEVGQTIYEEIDIPFPMSNGVLVLNNYFLNEDVVRVNRCLKLYVLLVSSLKAQQVISC